LNANSACYLLHTGFLLGLFFSPEETGDIFFKNVDTENSSEEGINQIQGV
jgi:hypothetical protein